MTNVQATRKQSKASPLMLFTPHTSLVVTAAINGDTINDVEAKSLSILALDCNMRCWARGNGKAALLVCSAAGEEFYPNVEALCKSPLRRSTEQRPPGLQTLPALVSVCKN